MSHKCSVGRESTNKANVLRELPCQQPPSTESIKVYANSSDAQTSHSTHVHNSETIRNDSKPFCSISNEIKDCETTEVKLDDLVNTCLYAKVTIGQQNIKLLVDTGSPYSLISQDVQNKLATAASLPITETRTCIIL